MQESAGEFPAFFHLAEGISMLLTAEARIGAPVNLQFIRWLRLKLFMENRTVWSRTFPFSPA